MNVLIIEDNYNLASQIQEILSDKIISNRVKIVHSYDSFCLESIDLKYYDIILVDIFLWDKKLRNWLNIVKEIREKWFFIPIVVITSISECSWIEKAFEYGASDYIIKPFRLAELIIRMQKWFRTYVMNYCHYTKEIIEYQWLEYKVLENQFYFQWNKICLSKKSKYVLFLLLMQVENIVWIRFLHEKLWGDSEILIERNARIIILRLKKTLQSFWLHTWIHTVRGEWYILRKT